MIRKSVFNKVTGKVNIALFKYVNSCTLYIVQCTMYTNAEC